MKSESQSGPVALAVGLWAIACWPLLAWYGRRVLVIPDQGWLLLAPLTAAVLMALERGKKDVEPGFRRWIMPSLMMAATGVAVPFLPMTLRAIPAVAALLFLPGPWHRGFWPVPAIAGLMAISLPAVAMLEFYFGYPLRAASAALAAPLLNFAGFQVLREGVMLAWRDRTIGVDVPCSGIRMGWTALYLAFTTAGLAGLGWGRTVALALGAVTLTVVVNALRVVALFGVEAFGLGARPVLHNGIGVVMFLLLAAGIAGMVRLLIRRTA